MSSMDYVDEANAYAFDAAKLCGKYEFLIAMQEDVQRIFMTEEQEAEYASYLATMEGEQYEHDRQVAGEPRTPATPSEAVDKEAFESLT